MLLREKNKGLEEEPTPPDKRPQQQAAIYPYYWPNLKFGLFEKSAE